MLLTGNDIEEICTVWKGSADRASRKALGRSKNRQPKGYVRPPGDQNNAVQLKGKVENDLRADHYFSNLRTAPYSI